MPDTLGQYTLGNRIGADAVADAYRATDASLGRTVTVKVLRSQVSADAGRLNEILHAARVVMPLSHPNIVELFDIEEQNGTHFLVFEHVTGETLRATIAGTPLNVRKALDLGMQLADALADAHGRGVIHGGLRPDTIVITNKGRAKIVDFGLVAVFAEKKAPQQASPDDVECQSPEQVLGERGDERTDLFALGCVLFEMLTGTSPFAAATGADTAVAILGRTPPPPSQMNARVPEGLDRLVISCVAKSLDRRASSAAMVASELRQISLQMEAAESASRRASAVAPAARSHRRSPIVISLMVLVLLLVLAAATYILTQ